MKSHKKRKQILIQITRQAPTNYILRRSFVSLILKFNEQIVNKIDEMLVFSKPCSNLKPELSWTRNGVISDEPRRHAIISTDALQAIYELFISNHENLVNLSKYCCYKPCLLNIRAFETLSSSVSQKSSTQTPHFDFTPPAVLRGIIYLTDVVSMENGPFIYRKENGRYKPIFGTKGTTIIFNANKLFHPATPALNGRKALDLVIAPQSIQVEGFMYAKVA